MRSEKHVIDPQDTKLGLKALVIISLTGVLLSFIAFWSTWNWEDQQHRQDFDYRAKAYSIAISASFDSLLKHTERLHYFVYNELILEKNDELSVREWQEMADFHMQENDAIRDIALIRLVDQDYEVVLANQLDQALLHVDMDVQSFSFLMTSMTSSEDMSAFLFQGKDDVNLVFMVSMVRDEADHLVAAVVVSWDIAIHIESVLMSFNSDGQDIDLFDLAEKPPLLLYHHDSRAQHQGIDFSTTRDASFRKPIAFMNRKWSLLLTASPAFFEEHNIIFSWVVLILGLLLTFVLSLFFWNMTRRHFLVEQEVIQRTEALHRAQKRYRRLSDTIPDAVGVHRYGKWIYVNPAAVSLLGVESKEHLLDRSVLDVVHEDDHERAISRILAENQDGVSFPLHEEHWLRVDGSSVFIELQAISVDWDEEIAMLIVVRDISARKESEAERQQMKEQVEHVQRLESLGVLAGGIAHDFNNILGAIMGNISIAQMELSDNESMMELLDQTETAAQRAADLCNQMLAYSGKGKFVIKTLHLSELIRDMLDLIRVSTDKHVQIDLDLADKLPTIDVDIAQMQQVIMNLMINASEAIGENAGIIHVHTSSCYADREMLAKSYLDEDLSEGHYVLLSIKDNGSGMSEETQKKIFDPFFTTKFTGRGLGMSAILGIIRGHKAAIYVDSEVGVGTTFKILFPSVLGEDLADDRKDTVVSTVWEGQGLVMLVDDEEMLRQVGKQLLKRMGFDVLLAKNGEHALKLFEQHQAKINLIIMDVMMPGMKGTDCVKKIRERDDHVQVIMSSGYSEQGVVSELESGMLFLQKPYNYQALQQAVRKSLQL